MRVQLLLKVGRLHDARHLQEDRIFGEPLMDERGEGTTAVRVTMRVSSPGSVEACGATRRLQLGDMLRRDKKELSLRIKKPADEPAGGGPIDPDSRACDPFHRYTSFRNLLS